MISAYLVVSESPIGCGSVFLTWLGKVGGSLLSACKARVALSVVINALATGQLDIKRATALLYGLQLASNNARGLYTEPSATNTVRTIAPSPEGLDLAEPGATFDTDDLYHFNEDEDQEDDEEEQFTEEPTNRFLERFSADPSPKQQQQDNGNPEIGAIGVDRC